MIDVPLLILVVGPTGSGKTDLAVALAQRLDTEVVSADSRQCYKEMAVGSAAPGPEQCRGIVHHFVGDRSVHRHLSAGQFEVEALQTLEGIWQRRPAAILCGGAGLFIRALVEGLDELGPENQDGRAYWTQYHADHGLQGLRDALVARDPRYAASTDLSNHQRMIRALEIMDRSGKPLSSMQTRTARIRPFRCLWIGLSPDRDLLYQRINHRVEAMDQAGLEAEALALFPWGGLKACQSPGYQEWEAYWAGTIGRASCLDLIRQHSRHYARRQLTWFRRNTHIHWIPPSILECEARLDWCLSQFGPDFAF